ncbi:MAG: nitroreductase family protein [Acidimicrobiales bacterium]
MDVNEALRGLRAVRDYAPDPVSPELVERWLETARWCGSSRNSQPWRFVVIRERGLLRALSALGDCAAHLGDAPLAVAVAAVEGPYPFSTIFDLGRAVQSLMVAAHADSVGSCIAVFEPAGNIDQARTLLAVPDRCRLDLAVAFGYPAADRMPGVRPRSSPRRPLTSLVGHAGGASPDWR